MSRLMATCHPERPSQGRGLCSRCYAKERYKTRAGKRRATCHPELPHTAHGLCHNCVAKLRRDKNPAAYSQVRAKYRATEKARAASKAYNRKRNVEKKYGIPLADFTARLETQRGLCGICKTDISGSWVTPTGKQYTKAAIDHCHSTGRVRGLLCSPCNAGLGSFKDNIQSLLAAAQYLTEVTE